MESMNRPAESSGEAARIAANSQTVKAHTIELPNKPHRLGASRTTPPEDHPIGPGKRRPWLRIRQSPLHHRAVDEISTCCWLGRLSP